MDIEPDERERLESLCPTTHPLNCVTKREQVNYSCICWPCKPQNYRKGFHERCKFGDAILISMTLYDLQDISSILKSLLKQFITFVANDCK